LTLIRAKTSHYKPQTKEKYLQGQTDLTNRLENYG